MRSPFAPLPPSQSPFAPHFDHAELRILWARLALLCIRAEQVSLPYAKGASEMGLDSPFRELDNP